MKNLLLFIALLFMVSCGQSNKTPSSNAFFQVDWQGLDLSEFKLNFGDKIRYVLDQKERHAIIVDFSKDEGGRWYGLCFINNEKIFGRQIPDGFTGNCVDLIDVTYFNENGIQELDIIDQYNLDQRKIAIGSRSPASKLQDLERDFIRGIMQREKEQTSCLKSIVSLNPINECYFDIDKILLE